MRWIALHLLAALALPLCSAQSGKGPLVYGKVREVSVGPDRSIWLTTQTGNVYRTEGIDSLWERGLQLNPGKSYVSLTSHFDRILFFSRDTAIMFGWIYHRPGAYDANAVYRTLDGGRHWSAVPFVKKDAWVRDGQILGPGIACISASNGRIYRTTDHGATWAELPRIFKKEREAYYRSPDLFSFHFANDSVAIATNRSNHLAVTRSGFASSTRIASPLDQGLFERTYEPYYLNGKGRRYVNNWSIDKVRIFGDHYVIMQNGRMYHTDRDTIHWQEFEMVVHQFETDPVSGRLFVVTADHGVGEVDQDFHFKSWVHVNAGVRPLNMRVVHDEVFLLFADHIDDSGKDVVREQVAGLTVTEKNVRRVSGYSVFRVTSDGIKFSSVKAE
jgi:hypothetical protein